MLIAVRSGRRLLLTMTLCDPREVAERAGDTAMDDMTAAASMATTPTVVPFRSATWPRQPP